MLQIRIPLTAEGWDEEKQEFVPPEEQILTLEHSLISLSKWESNWCKPFYSKKDKTNEEIIDYVKCMTLTRNVDPDVYNHLTSDNLTQIYKYIEAPMTATTFSNTNTGKKNREIVTSELIYYWMISLNIPSDYEKWHLNRLVTLIEVCSIKNAPPKKRSKSEIMRQNAALNAARRQQLNTKG